MASPNSKKPFETETTALVADSGSQPEPSGGSNGRAIDLAANKATLAADSPKGIIRRDARKSRPSSRLDNPSLRERFHVIYQRLKLQPSLDRPLVMGVTSTVRGEGRTLTALGLAIAISEQFPLPVLLVEADLEHPALAADLGTENLGLAEYLREELELDDLLYSTSVPDLGVVFAGNCQEDPLKVLRSERLANLFTLLSQQFAAVIVDMPPLSNTAEAMRLVSQVDQVLMVVEAASTPAGAVNAALDLIPEEKRAGVVLNRAQPSFEGFPRLRKLFRKAF